MNSRSKPQVVGVGQCSLDFLGTLERYPEVDDKAELSTLSMQGGGPVATALVTLARLGVPVAMVGAVGDDRFGRQIRRGLLAEKVDCSHLARVPDSTSQVAFVAVDAAGHRNIFWHRGPAIPRLPASLDGFLSGSVRILHLDGLHLDVAIASAELARDRQITTVLDGGTLRPGMSRLLPLIDHLVVSSKFAEAVQPGDPTAALRHLSAWGAQAVTITNGPSGSLSMAADGEIFHQPAFAVKAVDTTGCGDVFHGGYLFGLLQGWSLARTVRFAAACAALKTRALGGRTAIPCLTEVQTFLEAHRAC